MNPLCVTIQIKATEKYFHLVLFIKLYRVVLPLNSVDENKCVSIQVKAVEQYFYVVFFGAL